MTDPNTAAAERRRNIESIYPLAPLQEGILFHTLMAPDAGTYMPQIAFHLAGQIDGEALRRAWDQIAARHAVLRSGIHWEERDEPFQVVHRHVPPGWEVFDWRAQDTASQAASLTALFAANRARPFDLRRPPLLRVQWCRMGEAANVLVLCHHHIILDGWSTSQLLQEVMVLYHREIGHATPPLPAPRPYADYIKWLRQQDRAASLAFWQDYIAGTPGPSLVYTATKEASDFGRREWAFPEALAAGATAFCTAKGLTLNTLLQGVLGLYVAETVGRDDVFFGSATGGRPATLPGSTGMVGLFINALPVRIRLTPEVTVAAWLRALQQQQAATIAHEYIALRDIQKQHGTLFDCLLVVENYPVTVGSGQSDITLDRVEFDEWTHFPLTLLVAPGHLNMKLILRHDRTVLTDAMLEAFLARYTGLLRAVLAEPDAAVSTLIGPVAHAAPAQMAALAAAPSRPAETETERLLAGIWADVLHCDPPGAEANFFALGGHSLMAAKVVMRLRRALALEIPVRALFERPVLADLAAYADALRVGTDRAEGEMELDL